jgi:hypothetical protein
MTRERIKGVPPLRSRGKRSELQHLEDEAARRRWREQAERMSARGRALDAAQKGSSRS